MGDAFWHMQVYLMLIKVNARISPLLQAWSCCDTKDSGRKLFLTWGLKEKRDTFQPSAIELQQISRKNRGRSSLEYNLLPPPRKRSIKNTIEICAQFQLLFNKRVLTDFMFIKTQKLDWCQLCKYGWKQRRKKIQEDQLTTAFRQ